MNKLLCLGSVNMETIVKITYRSNICLSFQTFSFDLDLKHRLLILKTKLHTGVLGMTDMQNIHAASFSCDHVTYMQQ